MLLRDSLVAKLVRSYLLNVEEKIGAIAHHPMQDMVHELERHSDQLVENAMQLNHHAVELKEQAEQLRSQSRMIKAIVDEIYRSPNSPNNFVVLPKTITSKFEQEVFEKARCRA